jgi:hypothetical protein
MNYTLKQVIPSKVRKEVYFKAIEYFKNEDYSKFKKNSTSNQPLSLSMLLPCLFGLALRLSKCAAIKY